MMGNLRGLFLLVVLSLGVTVPFAAAAAPDRIFSATFQEALIVEGKAGYSAPLANAVVELRFGTDYNFARAAADGSFRIGVELEKLQPGTILELTARGVGAQAPLVWASPLGPAARLIDLAGAGRVLDFSKEPWVRINPRTTVAAAVMRNFNGGEPIVDGASFYRAALNRHVQTFDLVYALTAIERGELALPAGAADTFAAIEEPALAFELRDSFEDSGATWALAMPTDPELLPAMEWELGNYYSTTFVSNDDATQARGGYRLLSATAGQVISVSSEQPQPAPAADVSVDPNGTRLFTSSDGEPFDQSESYVYVDGQQVRAVYDTVALHARLTAGPGGLAELATGYELHVSYPDNPEIPEGNRTGPVGLPISAVDGALRSEFLDDLPEVATRDFALPVPFAIPANYNTPTTSPAMDSYHFNADGTGTLERFALPFTYTQSADRKTLLLEVDGWQSELQFLFETDPGIWYVRLHGISGQNESLIHGVLLERDLTRSWAVPDVPGAYAHGLNGRRGAYGSQWPVIYTFDANGTWESGTQTGTWRVEDGLLHYDRIIGGSVYYRFAWQLLREDDGHFWVLENTNYGALGAPPPPMEIVPTSRLIRLDRQ